MKEKYFAPVVQLDELEKADVLLASPPSIEENKTQKFSDFANKSLSEWGFSDNL